MRGSHRFLSIVLACAAGVFGLVGTAEAAKGDTTLVSRAGGFGPVGDGDSSQASTSADGRYVAFTSDATNLDPDNDSDTDVFVRDRVAGTTTLVSRATGPNGVGGNYYSTSPSISADGRYVAFDAFATNLDSESDDAVRDIFVRDLVSNTTVLVSRASGASGAVADGGSTEPSISADGRYVVFDSIAGNLTPESTPGEYQVYVRDLVANTTTLVSRATGDDGAVGDDTSFGSSISADGAHVAFRSYATNLDPHSSDMVVDVFVRDLGSDITTLVSRATGVAGAVGNDSSLGPALSADGRYIAFYSFATNLHPAADDTDTDVFVRDVVAHTTTLVSRPTGGTTVEGDGSSYAPTISAAGRHVAFFSYAANLDPASNSTAEDVFVRDLTSDTTTLVSRASGATGVVGDDDSRGPSISADGRYIAFQSDADNLDSASDDSVTDVFVRDMLGPQPPVALEVGDVALKEGKTGTSTAFIFDVTLDGVPGRTVTVDYATKNGTATVGDSDYAFTNGTLTFLPGETTKQITVTVNGDKKMEKSETFKVRLFDASGADIEDGTGVGTIKNDDR